MSDHAHQKSPLHDKPATAQISDEERIGLTSERAEELVKEYGYNELPVIEISLLYMLFLQFTGTMPYMLELACIVALACQDYADFGIILAMLCANGFLGFYEQLKAAESLKELTNQMEQKIAVLRDGKAEHLLTRLLVPGDVVLLLGGVQVPADIEWIEGDVLAVDTAALTGEPLPRKYPSDEYGPLILCASTILAGEAYGIVRKTGVNTEIGSTNVDIMKDKSHAKVSVFEERVLLAVKIIILVSLLDVIVIFIVQGAARGEFTSSGINEDLLTCLSIIIAAIPIALPIIMQVTMALGAGKMAREYHSVVTSLPALQDISSMTILCSDKTGTLTTARITIHAESVWCGENFSKQDVALYAVLASNRDKKEDAIDRSVVGYFDRVFGEAGLALTEEYTKVRSVGFSPVYKRVLYEYSHPKLGRVTIAKGLPTKVLNTSDGGADDAKDQWKCKDFEKIEEEVKKVDYDFSKAGYKTLGVAVKVNDNPFVFCGILPMLDPPRHDTKETINNLVNAGIEVKMITGDHLNIAKETAKLIGMGVNIHPGESIRDNSQSKNELIKAANGFAQVLPRDKREVVLVLKDLYKQVVGMTGDGVNDAPALSAAQCGIAVHDALDAAKNAAAIVLTSPGLSAIYSGVVESRRIFRKLKAYVTYRFAATIQIVVVLTLLIFISNCPINPTFVIILALFNDLTMLPIAYDFQLASAKPENPDVVKMLALSGAFGALETVFSLIFAYGAMPSSIFYGDYDVGACSNQTQAAIWLQMFISAEVLIFIARAPKYVPLYIAPSWPLLVSVLMGCLIASIMAGASSTFGSIAVTDIVIIWVYDFIGMFFLDVLKMYILNMYGESSETLPDEVPKEKAARKSLLGKKSDVEEGHEQSEVVLGGLEERGSIYANRLTDYALQKSDRLSLMPTEERESIAANGRAIRNKSSARKSITASDRISISSASIGSTGYSDLRQSLSMSGSLRPNIPSNRRKY